MDKAGMTVSHMLKALIAINGKVAVRGCDGSIKPVTALEITADGVTLFVEED